MKRKKMTLKEERQIISNAVKKAVKEDDREMSLDRNTVARRAAIISDNKGVNVISAPYLHDIFIEMLDKFEYLYED